MEQDNGKEEVRGLAEEAEEVEMREMEVLRDEPLTVLEGKTIEQDVRVRNLRMSMCRVGGEVVAEGDATIENCEIRGKVDCRGKLVMVNTGAGVVSAAISATVTRGTVEIVDSPTITAIKCEIVARASAKSFLSAKKCHKAHTLHSDADMKLVSCKGLAVIECGGTLDAKEAEATTARMGGNSLLDKCKVETCTVSGIVLRVYDTQLGAVTFLVPSLRPLMTFSNPPPLHTKYAMRWPPPVYRRQNMVETSQRRRRSVLNFSVSAMYTDSIVPAQRLELDKSSVKTVSFSAGCGSVIKGNESTVETAPAGGSLFEQDENGRVLLVSEPQQAFAEALERGKMCDPEKEEAPVSVV